MIPNRRFVVQWVQTCAGVALASYATKGKHSDPRLTAGCGGPRSEARRSFSLSDADGE